MALLRFRTIFCLMMLSAHPVFCQAPSDTTDFYALSLEELMNLPITTASKFEQSIKDAPSTVSLITRDQILKYGWLSGNEVLARLPGFSPSQDYDRMTISSRGIYEGWNNNHMLMLIDGIPMNDNMYGTAFTWEITPLVFTKSLEVIRGPGSALYGTNATNGVISYNTLSAKDLVKKAEVRYRVGNKGTQVFDLLAGHESESVSFVSAFNYYETDGDRYKSYDANATSKVNISNERANYYFFSKIEPKGKLSGISLQFHEQNWSFNTGHGWLFYKPDQPENMNENRRLISLRFKTPQADKKFQQEYLMRYQRHGVNWHTRLIPNDVYGYSYGLTEILKTSTSDLFTRLQWSANVNANTVLLGGVENSFLKYNGDDLHVSNVIFSGDYPQTPNNELLDAGSYFAWLGNNPFINTGVYAQFSTGLLDNKLKTTLGARYDYATFQYHDLYNGGKEEKKSYEKFSPRLSLIYAATDKLTIKLMGGRAFRTPAASELFGSNTYLLASNLTALKPEVITTFEAGMDFSLSSNFNWRLNAFRTTFDDQIAYSLSNFNLSTNLYSLTSVGVENEFTFKAGAIDGFLNHSFVQRQDEEIVDPTISVSKTKLTWVPQQIVNAGVKYTATKYHLALQGHYQGEVNRRNSDQDLALNALRGASVDAWFTLDLRGGLKVNDNLEIGIISTNITDTKGMLLKNNAFAFDYQMPGRSILLDLRFLF